MHPSPPKVTVRLVLADTGESFGVVHLAPDELPESFLSETTLHVAEREWSVVEADPAQREDFARSGELTLKLSPIVEIPTDHLLFSLPTVTDELPDDGDRADGSESALSEDDWRQVELVAESLRADVADELAAVHGIWEHQRRGAGFATLHVRRGLPRPLAGADIDASELHGLFPAEANALRLEGHGTRVADGFAHVLPCGGLVYGLVEGSGRLRVIGVRRGEGELGETVRRGLAALAARHQLIAIDWCRMLAGRPDEAAFDHALSAGP